MCSAHSYREMPMIGSLTATIRKHQVQHVPSELALARGRQRRGVAPNGAPNFCSTVWPAGSS